MSLSERFLRELLRLDLGQARAVVAVSGGPDSVALLDLLHRTRHEHGLTLGVVHVDHGLVAESAMIADQVTALAQSYGFPVEVVTLELDPAASETTAREQRYQALSEVTERHRADFVITAHHEDDQVETVLMRVLAGSGPAGLAGMEARGDWIVRPLLPFRHAELVRHVQAEGLPSWDDPANENPRHTRSWLRSVALPQLIERLPRVKQNLLSLSRHAAADREAWDVVLDSVSELDWRTEVDGGSVAALPLAGYDSALGVSLIQAMSRRLRCPMGRSHASRVLEAVRRGRTGTVIEVPGPWRAEVAFGRLRLVQAEESGVVQARVVGEGIGEVEWGRWSFAWWREAAPPTQERSALEAWFRPTELTVRTALEGERLRPLGGTGRRLVTRCFQDARVPRSQRERWPVFEAAGGIVWIPGVCRADALVPQPGTEALRVNVRHS